MKSRQSISDKRRASEKAKTQKELCYKYSEISHDINVYSLDAERAERIKEVLQALYDVNKRVPIIVEGKRDMAALRKIGFVGDIITLHAGKGIYEFCEGLAEKYQHVVLLMDWDDKGEKLYSALAKELKGFWEEFSPLRDIMKVLCQKDIKDIEGIPGLLERLAGTEVVVGEIEL